MPRVYPEWFVKELVRDIDKKRAISGELTSNDVVEFMCSVHGVYSLQVKKRIFVSKGEPNRGCPLCGRARQYLPGLAAAAKKNKELMKDKNYCVNLTKGLQRGKRAGKEFPEWFISDLLNEEDKELARNSDLGSHQELWFNCKIHGPYKQWMYQHINISSMTPKCSCPKCARVPVTRSYKEDEVNNYIQGFRDLKVEKNARGYIKSSLTGHYYEIDLFYPELNLGIEFNGSYWHSTEGLKMKEPKDKNYHMDKFLSSEAAGIHLIQIFDVDWETNSDKIKMYLKSIVLSNKRIYARKCRVEQITVCLARDFCNLYHIQGFSNNGSKNYGLFYEDELVSVMSYGLQRFNQRGSGYYELHRYCVKDGYVIVGGANKLQKAFLRDVKIHEIVSYSDNDYFMGGIYEKLGYKFSGYTNPRYYWFKDGAYLKREQCMLKNLQTMFPETYENSKDFDGNKEDRIMILEGWYKVYRAGNKKWIYREEN